MPRKIEKYIRVHCNTKMVPTFLGKKLYEKQVEQQMLPLNIILNFGSFIDRAPLSGFHMKTIKHVCVTLT